MATFAFREKQKTTKLAVADAVRGGATIDDVADRYGLKIHSIRKTCRQAGIGLDGNWNRRRSIMDCDLSYSQKVTVASYAVDEIRNGAMIEPTARAYGFSTDVLEGMCYKRGVKTIDRWAFRKPTMRAKGMSKEQFYEWICTNRVRDDKTGCLLWTGSKNKLGYGTACWCAKPVLVHHWICEYENGRESVDGECVLHSCDTPACSEPTHLRFGTRIENNADRMRRGRHRSVRGEASGMSKLKECDIPQIRDLIASGRMSNSEIGRAFGVTNACIFSVMRGETWKHVI